MIFKATARDEFYFPSDQSLQDFEIFTCGFKHKRATYGNGYARG
jgi:hypothetical protein